MPAAALGLVLAAALLHATWNLVAKRAGGDRHFALASALFVGLLWAPVVAWRGAGEIGRWGGVEWGVVAASAALHLAYFTILLRGYRLADLTVVYPVARGTAPLLAVAGALFWLGEPPSVAGAAGALLVCGGVFVLAGGPALLRPAADAAARWRVAEGLRWGMASGAFVAAYSVLDAYAVKRLGVDPVLLDYVGNVLRVPLLLPAALSDGAAFARALRRQWRHALVVATLGPLAYVLVLYAVTMAPLSHVAPAREVSMLFAALIGGRLLGEGDRGARIAGAGCIAAGVIALALA